MTVEVNVSNSIPSIRGRDVRELIKKKDKFSPLGTTIGEVDCRVVLEGQLEGSFRKNQQMCNFVDYIGIEAGPVQLHGGSTPGVGIRTKRIIQNDYTTIGKGVGSVHKQEGWNGSISIHDKGWGVVQHMTGKWGV